MSLLPTPTNPFTILYVDGGSNRITRAANNGRNEAWGSVVWGDGTDAVEGPVTCDLEIRRERLAKCTRNVIIAHNKDVKFQHNNFAELLAMLYALRIACRPSSSVVEIYSDSRLMLSYWSLNRVSATVRHKMSAGKREALDEVVALRRRYENRGGQMLKIPGKYNLADLGYHK